MDDINEKMERITGEPQPEKPEPSLAMEILQELKSTIKRLWIAILVLAAVIVIQFCVNTYERMQYDYTSTIDAVGVYTAVDHSGNIVAQDVDPEMWAQFERWLTENGKN